MKKLFIFSLAILFIGSMELNAQWVVDGDVIETEQSANVKARSMTLGEDAGSDPVRFELGATRTANGPAFFDLIGDIAYPDYGVRLIRWNDGRSDFAHRGNKAFRFLCVDSAPISFTIGTSKALFIAPDGKIGVNTDVPSANLSINGNAEAEEIEVKQDVADYVFQDDYQLMPLEELEKYIEENGHLPNIQTQKDVENNNGYVKLGDLSVSLMEKMEELTLHVIKLNQQVQDLKKENELLKRTIENKE